ncbi:MAG: hypothetical protein KBS66_08440 [Eubacterium sp.]|nr:hypothetical protein [Candidatus Colimonas fimequi]
MSDVYLSIKAIRPLKEYLKETGINVHYITGAGSQVDKYIRHHADLYMCQFGIGENAQVFMGEDGKLGPKYPQDAVYNAAAGDKLFIHKLAITDPALLDAAKDMGLEPVDVRQGYARCSCLPLPGNSFITPDIGISEALMAAGADTLVIEPAHVFLEGYRYGFLGGTCGTIMVDDQLTLVFNGDVTKHPNGYEIIEFAQAHGVAVKYFDGEPLTDIGSIIYSHK